MENIIENKVLNNNSLNQKAKRESNFELLRIIAMLLIVVYHLALHGIPYDRTGISSFNNVVINVLSVCGKLGVNLFVLISGYFLVNSTFKIKKLLQVIIQVVFYDVLIYVLLCIFNNTQFSVKQLAFNFFGFAHSSYWFVTAYIVMYSLSPFINKMIKALTQKEHLYLVCCLLIFTVVVPFIDGIWSWGISNVGWFITLYIVAAYVRLYPQKILSNTKIMLLIFAISYLIMTLANVLGKSLCGATQLLCVVCSISLFCGFKNITIKHNKIINLISSTTFGVYLIHDNGYFRSVLWGGELLKIFEHAYNNKLFILYAIGCIVGVFVACSLIDLLRQFIFKQASKIKLLKLKNKTEN